MMQGQARVDTHSDRWGFCMTKWLLVFSLTILIGFSTLGASSVDAAQPKFAFVNVSKAIDTSNATKRARKIFRRQLASKRKEIAGLEKQVKRLKSQLDNLTKKGSLANRDKVSNLKEKFRRKYRQYQRLVEDNQVAIERENSKWSKKITRTLRDVIQEIGRERGYTAIYAHGQALYHNPAIDITDIVLKRLNARTSKWYR